MSFLLDTCFLSELVRSQPSPSVVEWLGAQNETDLYVSVITLGEIWKGVERLPISKRRSQLEEWVSRDLQARFRGRWLEVDARVCTIWGKMLARAEAEGNSLPAVDSILAATALSRSLSLVTRNTRDFEKTGVSLVNPWL